MSSIIRSVQAMDLLARKGPLGVRAVAQQLQLPLGSVHRMLLDLAEAGVADRTPSGEWELSFRLLEITGLQLERIDLPRDKLVEEARRRAPTVLFFDEFDALGSTRGRMESHFWKTLVDQLLQEMDGMAGRNEDVLIFAATNVPWNVDPAFRRPGRFDRVLFVPPPDEPARAQILGSPGEYAWGGAASTAFWCDPAEDMAVLLLTQLMPSSTYPIRRELRVLTYQAIID